MPQTTNNQQRTTKNPPRIFLNFFRWFCHPKLLKYIEGDLMELYEARVNTNGKLRADIRFVIDVLLLLRPAIIRPAEGHERLNTYGMYKSYIKIAYRILIRNKGYSGINISGLAIGMAASILILLWVQNEVSYDNFFSNSDRIYKMYSRDTNNGKIDVWENTPALLAPELNQSYAEVESAVRNRIVFFLIKTEEEHFNEQGAFVDSDFLSMFDFTLLQGNKDALKNDFGIVLSKKLAIKLFGQIDCLGKTVIVNDSDNFSVTGVLDDLPSNTEFTFEYLLPWNYFTRLGWGEGQTWAYTNASTYVILKEGVSAEEFDFKVSNLVKMHISAGDGSTREILAHPLTKAHLYSEAENGQLTTGRIETVKLFSAIAILIILIACINFMNLSTARSEKRAREVGVRKIVGAFRGALIFQFISESILIVGIAFIIALGLVQLSLTAFNSIVGTPLHIEFSSPQFWLYTLALIFTTGLLAGSYPAFFLSSTSSIKVLKGTFKNENALVTPRKVLVILQFSFAIVLSICAIVVQRQIQFAQNRDTGYDKTNVAYHFMQGEIPLHYNLIRNELLSSGAAVSVTRTYSPITRIWGQVSDFTWQGSSSEDKKRNFLFFGADVDMTKTFGMEVLMGRDIDITTFPADTTSVLLNETAVEIMRLKDPIGEIIQDANGTTWQIVGVVKDFIVESPYDPISPMIIGGWNDRYGVLNFKLNTSLGEKKSLEEAEQVFKKYNPEYPFEYYFAQDTYNQKFGNEKQIGTMAGLFSGLTIFISCLGLFGLAAYMAETRTKEIGVRKILGASTAKITTHLSKEFIKLVLLAIVIASPIAWFLADYWLESYNYKVSIGIGLFVKAALVTIFIALLTVSFQAVKAALANPVDSLKSE